MSENVWLGIFAAASGASGGLALLFLTVIIHELRALRQEIRRCVSDNMCRVMMTAHEKRIEKIEESA